MRVAGPTPSTIALARPATPASNLLEGGPRLTSTSFLPSIEPRATLGARRRATVAAGRLTPAQLQQLIDLVAANPGNAWPVDRDIADGRNKHRTNLFNEIRDGIAGPYDWLESDVRMQDGRPVAAHDRRNRSGLTMAEWLQVGAASGRGLKFDFKEAAAIAPVVALVQAAHVLDERLLWNVTILDRDQGANASMATLQQLRKLFPHSVINLSLGTVPYSDAVIQKAVAVAQAVGGPIMFPLNAAYVSPSVVQKFRTGGKVAIWNSTATYNPRSIPADTAKFRSWGVDGMIDLESTHFSAGTGDALLGGRSIGPVPPHRARA